VAATASGSAAAAEPVRGPTEHDRSRNGGRVCQRTQCTATVRSVADSVADFRARFPVTVPGPVLLADAEPEPVAVAAAVAVAATVAVAAAVAADRSAQWRFGP
jgi:hypothetical protein